MEKRGQAAMEFLMTYGWAILAAIIAIGVLAYFGVFSPGQYVGSSAVVTAPWYANAWNVDDATEVVTTEFRNNGGENLDIQSFSIAFSDPFSDTCTNTYAAPGLTVLSGDLQTITIDTDTVGVCDTATRTFAPGDTVRGDITIIYERPGSDVDLTSTGTITDTAA